MPRFFLKWYNKLFKHPVDDTADKNGTFIYPDLETALVGCFNVADNTLLEASEATIGNVNVNSFGIMEPLFDKVKTLVERKIDTLSLQNLFSRRIYFWAKSFNLKNKL